MSKTRCGPRMLSHVINIPFIALHSTHAALQQPRSPLLPCRRNISFPTNSIRIHSNAGNSIFSRILRNILQRHPCWPPFDSDNNITIVITIIYIFVIIIIGVVLVIDHFYYFLFTVPFGIILTAFV